MQPQQVGNPACGHRMGVAGHHIGVVDKRFVESSQEVVVVGDAEIHAGLRPHQGAGGDPSVL
ncbi:Uncharacterised protein [Mycobacteroides abscessus subsp. abscessus]|nr:Uncharacterised protein [Mycobacteroides abscessus subsp. abscessus]